MRAAAHEQNFLVVYGNDLVLSLQACTNFRMLPAKAFCCAFDVADVVWFCYT